MTNRKRIISTDSNQSGYRKYRLAATLMLAALLASPSGWTQAERDNAMPAFADMQQQAMELKQSVLTYSEQQRQDLIAETRATLNNFDRRIDNLQQSIDARSEDMSAAAERYADELLNNLMRQRQDLAQWFSNLRRDGNQAWDDVIYGFSSAYDDFYESWEDLEAQFGHEQTI
jgi:tellurite resistance protein